MRIVTGSEMAKLDQTAIQAYGIPSAALMERAGYETARTVREMAGGDLEGVRVHVLCGGGNNGGDGFVAARSLANWGARVRVFLLVPAEKLKGDPKRFFHALQKMEIPIGFLSDKDPQKLIYSLKTTDFVIDAMLGTGLTGPLRPEYAEVARAVNDVGRPVVAVDIPTGVQADTGRIDGDAVRADRTVTFGLPKLGHLLEPGSRYTGTLRVAEIGFPRSLLDVRTPNRVWCTRSWAQAAVRPRPRNGHKGTFGRVVVVAGSFGMAGAAALAALGALRGGAGLVVWAGPESILPVVQTLVPEATAVPLGEKDGKIHGGSVDDVLERLRDGDVLVLGPGIGCTPETAEAVSRLLRDAPVPAVVDADGLNALALHARETAGALPPDRVRVYTPHPKEASRLLGTDTGQVLQDRVEAVARISGMWKGTCLLKGTPTLVKAAEGPLFVNGSGDVSLATGGSGDVLTGLVASLLAQGYPPGEAAALGAYVHGLAGEMLAADVGRHASTAREVARFVGEALKALEAGGR